MRNMGLNKTPREGLWDLASLLHVEYMGMLLLEPSEEAR